MNDDKTEALAALEEKIQKAFKATDQIALIPLRDKDGKPSLRHIKLAVTATKILVKLETIRVQSGSIPAPRQN